MFVIFFDNPPSRLKPCHLLSKGGYVLSNIAVNCFVKSSFERCGSPVETFELSSKAPTEPAGEKAVTAGD